MKKTGKFSNYLKRSYIRYAVILIIIMFVLFIAFITVDLRYTTINKNQSCNTNIVTFLNSRCQLYDTQIRKMSESKSIKEALVQKNKKTDVCRQLYGYSARQQLKSIFMLLDSDENIIATNLYKPNQLICESSSKTNDIVNYAKNSPDHMYSGVSGIKYDNHQETCYIFCHAVMDGKKIIGYLCFDITAESLDNYMIKNEVDIISLTDRFDNAFYYTSNSIVDSMEKCKLNWTDKDHVTICGKPYYGVSTFLPDTNIKVITLTSVWLQNQVCKFAIYFIICLSVLMVGLVFSLSRKVAINNSCSINELLLAVKQCRNGNIGYRINSVTFDEFQHLYNEFNEMMVQLQLLIQHNNELMERKRIMEIKQLEEQFNPHFVFNVMETLKYEIMIDQKQASKMVVSFANLMRYSINYGNVQVPVRTDITYIEDYLMLQKMRYNKHLMYNIDIEEELLDYKIPKLLLQPIVENSVSHGVENVDCITINVIGRKKENSIELIVEDDGMGIKKDKLKRIKQLLENENVQTKHIGLYNVHRVIRLLYNDDYGLNIISKYGVGTKVVLNLPIKKDENDV